MVVGALLLSHIAPAELINRALKSDEIVQLADATARIANDGTAKVRVHAYVYEQERRPGARAAFEKYLRIDVDTLPPEQRANYQARTKLMLIDAERGKQLYVQGESGAAVALPRTDKRGSTVAKISLPMSANTSMRWINYSVSGPILRFTGRALIVPDAGTSIISDIDDTIRDTHVLNTHEMLMNTFVRPLKAVPGMQPLYMSAAENPTLRIHYLSNAPHALYPLLQQFLRESKFPEGSIHPRAINLTSTAWNKVFHADHIDGHKAKVIETLMADFPIRSFVLIGDTGEQDPAIYGAMMRKFPNRVQMILLHDVTGDNRESPRYARDMRSVPAAKWRLFKQASELTLSDLRLFDAKAATP
jgi:phosphatidate phosphatase APP1